jgi:hypothetical protein
MMQNNYTTTKSEKANPIGDIEYLEHVESALSAFDDLEQYVSPQDLPLDINELESELSLLEEAHRGGRI